VHDLDGLKGLLRSSVATNAFRSGDEWLALFVLRMQTSFGLWVRSLGQLDCEAQSGFARMKDEG
jgi:hypothetical protein